MNDIPKSLQIDNLESYTSIVKNAQKALRELKKKLPLDIDCWRVRCGKTIFCFTSKERMNRKLKYLEDYEIAAPGESLPPKKISL